jgi:oxaloacetate decarboxylase beta subunit
MVLDGFSSFLLGFANFHWTNGVMILIGCGLLYLGIKKDMEPLLLVPIGFGAILVNIPLAGLMEKEGLLRHFYEAGVLTEIFPCLIFIGIGAMTDFGPLLENPRILLLGGAGQFGIFLTLLLALLLGFDKLEAVAIGIIGACDGPTSIYVTSKYAPHMLGAVSVAAYCYMSLVPILQPPIMRLLTSEKERRIVMKYQKRSVSKAAKIVFPIAVTLVTGLIAPMGTPLMGTLMLGNLLRESGVADRLVKASQNEIANIVTLLLGISIGATMAGPVFLKTQTLIVLGLGLVAICLDTAMGIFLAKAMNWISGGKINPLIGAAGISAFPMSARVVQAEGQKANKKNYLLMHAMGANTGGQIGSVLAAAVMLSLLKGMGIV